MSQERLLISAPKVAEPWSTSEKSFGCPHCQGKVIVTYPYLANDLDKALLTREALDEHRRVCTKAPATEARVYEISYPRV